MHKSAEHKVFLVGAGPGDADLLTVRALHLIKAAEVIVYDRLVSAEVLALIPTGTKRVYVGKASGHHHMGQEAINELLLKLVRSGRQVVRLKGGDPFIFGRGSEEALFLVRHGVGFEVVPGITAAAACSAYAGIPLTHRGAARSVRLVTGHCRGDECLDLNWESLADADTTLVFYMGLANLQQVSSELIAAGLEPATPAALVENGTTPDQRRVLTCLQLLPDAAMQNNIQAPALVIVGQVAGLATELDWFVPNEEAGEQVRERLEA